MLTNSYSIRNISKELERYSSTISRETNRNKVDINKSNKDNDKHKSSRDKDNKSNNKDKNKKKNNNNNNNNEYCWFKAQCRSKDIRFKNINKIQKYSDLQDYIIDKLNKKWSPEQISGRLRFEGSNEYVSYGTIYSYIYKNNNKDLIKLLPSYIRRIHVNNKCLIKKHTNLPSIHNRTNSNSINSWEADLIHFGIKTKQNVTTLFNRLTKFVRLIKNVDGKATTVLEGIYKNSKGIKTLTMDRGIEFLRPSEIKQHKINPYYCDPMRPGQKGGVENTNRRLRRWLPKKMNIDTITQKDLDLIANEINNIPRKCIGYKTPKEFYENYPKCCTSSWNPQGGKRLMTVFLNYLW